jgi:hypothetical protein
LQERFNFHSPIVESLVFCAQTPRAHMTARLIVRTSAFTKIPLFILCLRLPITWEIVYQGYAIGIAN